MALAGRLGDTGVITLELAEPGAGQGQRVPLPIDAWHRGEEEPDLIGSLGIEPGLLPIVGEVVPDAPAAAAGFRSFDRIVAVGDTPIESWGQWVEKLQASPGVPLAVTVRRDDAEQVLNLVPGVRPGADPAQGKSGYAGVGPYVREIVYGPLAAMPRAVAGAGGRAIFGERANAVITKPATIGAPPPLMSQDAGASTGCTMA